MLYLVPAVVLYRYSLLYRAVSAVAVQIQRGRDRELYRRLRRRLRYSARYSFRTRAGAPASMPMLSAAPPAVPWPKRQRTDPRHCALTPDGHEIRTGTDVFNHMSVSRSCDDGMHGVLRTADLCATTRTQA